MTVEWLPALVLLGDYEGNWNRYLDAIYVHFKRDFLDSLPEFRGCRMGIKRYPKEGGKEATFWHMISEGAVEADRLPDMRRCERICWPRTMIEKEQTRQLAVWRQKRTDERIAIALDDFTYIVILAVRKTPRGIMFLPWTAFCVQYEYQRKKYRKEWEKNRY